MNAMNEQAVQKFWQDHACGDAQVGGLHERFGDDYEKFFTDYDRFRYQNERHLAACVDALNVDGQRVLVGVLDGATDASARVRVGTRSIEVPIATIDRARLVFELTPTPKGGAHKKKNGSAGTEPRQSRQR